MSEPGDREAEPLTDAELVTARSAITHGAVWDGATADGVTKDEALEWAARLFPTVDHLTEQVRQLTTERDEALGVVEAARSIPNAYHRDHSPAVASVIDALAIYDASLPTEESA